MTMGVAWVFTWLRRVNRVTFVCLDITTDQRSLLLAPDRFAPRSRQSVTKNKSQALHHSEYQLQANYTDFERRVFLILS